MADGSDLERSEAPTEKRLAEARRDGRVARSPELATAAALLTGAAVFKLAAPAAGSRLVDNMAGDLGALGQAAGGEGAVVALLRGATVDLMTIVLVLAAGSALAALAVAGVQGQGVFSAKPITPDFSRLNPLSNAKRVFGFSSLAELGKALVKLGIVGWAVWRVLVKAWPDLLDLGARSPLALLEAAQRHAVALLASAGAAFLALALADWMYQKWQLTQSLKMTKEEVRQEMKQTEGDPTLKGRMRQVARARIRRQMFADVKKADLVLVNPTHIAIAIKYDPMFAPAPIVLAMGERLIAERIKQLAYEHKVPVIQNKPLARALIRSAKVGMMIPAELYAAVAEVLAFVLRQRRRRGAFAGARA